MRRAGRQIAHGMVVATVLQDRCDAIADVSNFWGAPVEACNGTVPALARQPATLVRDARAFTAHLGQLSGSNYALTGWKQTRKQGPFQPFGSTGYGALLDLMTGAREPAFWNGATQKCLALPQFLRIEAPVPAQFVSRDFSLSCLPFKP